MYVHFRVCLRVFHLNVCLCLCLGMSVAYVFLCVCLCRHFNVYLCVYAIGRYVYVFVHACICTCAQVLTKSECFWECVCVIEYMYVCVCVCKFSSNYKPSVLLDMFWAESKDEEAEEQNWPSNSSLKHRRVFDELLFHIRLTSSMNKKILTFLRATLFLSSFIECILQLQWWKSYWTSVLILIFSDLTWDDRQVEF